MTLRAAYRDILQIKIDKLMALADNCNDWKRLTNLAIEMRHLRQQLENLK